MMLRVLLSVVILTYTAHGMFFGPAFKSLYGTRGSRLIQAPHLKRSERSSIDIGNRLIAGQDWKGSSSGNPAVQLKTSGQLWCSGVLVKENLVVTAASCLVDAFSDTALVDPSTLKAKFMKPSELTVFAGELTLKQGDEQGTAQSSNGKMIRAGPGFNWWQIGSDIGTLELQKPFKLGQNSASAGRGNKGQSASPVGTTKVCDANVVQNTQDFTAIGFGGVKVNTKKYNYKDKSTYPTLPNTVQLLKVTKMTIPDCIDEVRKQKLYWVEPESHDTLMCFKGANAKGPDNSACMRDIGGGVFAMNNNDIKCVVAIMNTGFLCKGSITVATKIKPYAPWIGIEKSLKGFGVTNWSQMKNTSTNPYGGAGGNSSGDYGNYDFANRVEFEKRVIIFMAFVSVMSQV